MFCKLDFGGCIFGTFFALKGGKALRKKCEIHVLRKRKKPLMKVKSWTKEGKFSAKAIGMIHEGGGGMKRDEVVKRKDNIWNSEEDDDEARRRNDEEGGD
ncbi:hypothetical protein GOBAR_AA24897 [Gossypium barbadense]|uniref:Uncharacterized protein n=1 Tax=Gossypium barbadense TaxID=3634 RepID=A0A2P5WXG0_GOSBA|nr:hypothetical protein GOBAR_AA24897 [Gossypium barbadense]